MGDEMDKKYIKTFALALICVYLLTACTTLRHSKHMQIDGDKISYAAIGEGPVTIVLESGLGDGMESWDGIMDEMTCVSY
jgi:hypothetical protein